MEIIKVTEAAPQYGYRSPLGFRQRLEREGFTLLHSGVPRSPWYAIKEELRELSDK